MAFELNQLHCAADRERERARERRKPTKFVCQTHFHIMINMRGHCYALSSFPGALLLKGIWLSHGAR